MESEAAVSAAAARRSSWLRRVRKESSDCVRHVRQPEGAALPSRGGQPWPAYASVPPWSAARSVAAARAGLNVTMAGAWASHRELQGVGTEVRPRRRSARSGHRPGQPGDAQRSGTQRVLRRVAGTGDRQVTCRRVLARVVWLSSRSSLGRAPVVARSAPGFAGSSTMPRMWVRVSRPHALNGDKGILRLVRLCGKDSPTTRRSRCHLIDPFMHEPIEVVRRSAPVRPSPPAGQCALAGPAVRPCDREALVTITLRSCSRRPATVNPTAIGTIYGRTSGPSCGSEHAWQVRLTVNNAVPRMVTGQRVHRLPTMKAT